MDVNLLSEKQNHPDHSPLQGFHLAAFQGPKDVHRLLLVWCFNLLPQKSKKLNTQLIILPVSET